MDSEDDFTRRLMGFGLTEKEAHCYFYLLKYGSKKPSVLAKALKTYREDAQRMLARLTEKGMVRPSLTTPTTYTAVELQSALESAVKKRESELREMETRKRELQDLSKQQRLRPSDNISKFQIIKSIKNLVAVMLPAIDSLEEEWVSLVPSSAASISPLFGLSQAQYEAIQRGVKVRLIIDISYAILDLMEEYLDNGVDVRHCDEEGIYFTIFDRKTCISAISTDISRFTLDEPIAALWTDDATYARYLMSTFEAQWGRSVLAEERIKELRERSPSQTNH